MLIFFYQFSLTTKIQRLLLKLIGGFHFKIHLIAHRNNNSQREEAGTVIFPITVIKKKTFNILELLVRCKQIYTN